MSEADIERMVMDRSLARETFRDEQVALMWSKAAASYADSGVPGLTTDGAFQHLYTAALQAAIATLAAHGLRVKSTANHYKTFYALRKLADVLEPHGVMFDELRGTRNESVYEAGHDEVNLAELLSEARAFMPGSMAALRAAIIAVRPGIASRLRHVG